jgi:hypothetical protein
MVATFGWSWLFGRLFDIWCDAADNCERARRSGTPGPLDTALLYERTAGKEIRRALKQVEKLRTKRS